jgi:hypothetical protein
MKKLCWVLLVTVAAVSPLTLLGAREVLLTEVNCALCRKWITVLGLPEDANLPVASARVDNGSGKISIFPRYVGDHWLVFYPDGAFEDAEISADMKCRDPLKFIATSYAPPPWC